MNVYEEVGSGLNSQRQRCTRLMEPIERGPVRRRISAQKDRLVRFGFDGLAAFCQRHGTDLLGVNGETGTRAGARPALHRPRVLGATVRAAFLTRR
jgi:predicted site-specific integrase-resolvase